MTFKTLLAPLLMSILWTAAPQASLAGEGGSHGGGGGDMESEFKDIASNISDWMQSGGSAALHLPRGLKDSQYRAGMKAVLGSYSIEMVSKTLNFGGSTKTCVSRVVSPAEFAKLHVHNQIMCNQTLFRDTYQWNIEGAYRLVHHEFAGLAGLEQNRGQDSDYSISKQIADLLERQTVLRLPVGNLSRYQDPKGLLTAACGNYVVLQSDEAVIDESGFGDFRSEVSARDVVIALLKNKRSALTKALLAKKILAPPVVYKPEDGSPLGSYSVGENVGTGGGGRVENSYTDSMIPIYENGKRYEQIVAYIKVHEADAIQMQPGDLPLDPKATEDRVFRITGVLTVDDPTLSFVTPDEIESLTSKACHPTSIPKNKKDGEIDLWTL